LLYLFMNLCVRSYMCACVCVCGSVGVEGGVGGGGGGGGNHGSVCSGHGTCARCVCYTNTPLHIACSIFFYFSFFFLHFFLFSLFFFNLLGAYVCDEVA